MRKANIIFVCLLCCLINSVGVKAETNNTPLLMIILEPYVQNGLDVISKKIQDWIIQNKNVPLSPRVVEDFYLQLEQLHASVYASSTPLTSYQKAVALYHKKSYKEALDLFGDLSGYSEASFMLGLMYCNGNGVAKHSYSANKYFKNANSLCICTDHNVLRCD